MKHILLLLCALLAGCLTTLAQTDSIEWQPQAPQVSKPKGLELSRGDAMPDYTFKNPLINHPTKEVRLSDFADKLVIMEIWSLNCASCIAGFPKLQQLQERFGNSLQVILVNPWIDKEGLEQLMERRRKLFGFDLQLPVAYGDTDLYDMFTVDGTIGGVPHFVWIYQGKIISVTGSVHAESIQAILNGEEVEMEQKYLKFSAEFEDGRPLFVAGNAGNGEGILWHSVLSKEVPGLSMGKANSTNVHTNKSKEALNVSIERLFQIAYSYKNPYNHHLWDFPRRSRLTFEVCDTSKYVSRVNGRYNWRNRYCYQLFAPSDTDDKLMYGYMQQDLQRYFGLVATWEKREVECLVITCNDHDLLTDKVGRTGNGIQWKNAYLDAIEIKSATMAEFVDFLERRTRFGSYWPIIDETGFDGQMVDAELVGISDYDSPIKWNMPLRKYGLRFEIQKRVTDILVIKEAVQ